MYLLISLFPAKSTNTLHGILYWQELYSPSPIRMKNEWKICRGSMIEQAVVATALWFSMCTLLCSLSLYGWMDSILYNSSPNLSYFIPTSSIIEPLQILDDSSLAWTLPRMQDTSTRGIELLLTGNHDVGSKDVKTEHTFFGGISEGYSTKPTREEYVLLAFKHSIVEDPLGVLDSWYFVGGEEGFFCSWIGVTCDLQREHVVALNLAGMQLRGAITDELHDLPLLATLNLSSNFLHGTVPGELSHCRALRYLDLSKNQLSGPMPSALGNLKFLEGLWLQDNHLSGPLPHTLSNCRRLIILYLSNNKLTGSVPTRLSRLRYLQIIGLRGNGLTGSVPAALGRCSALTLVDLSKNKLIGIIPPELGNLENLQALDLSKNHLSGEIPASFANFTKLISLSLNDNQLTGVLPTAIFTLSSLVYLSLGKNLLKGNILGNLKEVVTSNLRYIDISQNQLTESIPATFASTFRFICYLNLSQNSISGSIPSEFGRLRSLVLLDLSRNSLVGSIPSEIGSIISLRHLDVSSNTISGKRTASRSRSPPLGLILIPVTAVIGLVALGVSIWFCAHRNYHGCKGRREVIICPEIKCFPSLGFTLTAQEVRKATESCNESNVIGSGRLSCVFKVVVTPRTQCAVRKIVKNLNYRTQRRLVQELQTLGSLRHRNLVRLLAYFFDAQTNALIYEYMADESLEKHLLQKQEVCWVTRFTVAVDVARALVYLHDDSPFPIVHGNLKPSNIFVNITRSGTRVGDVGLGRYGGLSFSLEEDIVDLSEAERRHEAYTAPEVLHATRAKSLDPTADVYSFGVILLELITGTGTHRYFGECLPQAEFFDSLSIKLERVLDPAGQLGSYSQEIKQCLRIASLCINQRPQERPPMRDILRMLIQVPREDS